MTTTLEKGLALLALLLILAAHSIVGHMELADCERTNFELCGL